MPLNFLGNSLLEFLKYTDIQQMLQMSISKHKICASCQVSSIQISACLGVQQIQLLLKKGESKISSSSPREKHSVFRSHSWQLRVAPIIFYKPWAKGSLLLVITR